MTGNMDTLVADRLARIETKLDQLLHANDDKEARIRRLERALWLATGAAATAGGVIGSLAGMLLGSR